MDKTTSNIAFLMGIGLMVIGVSLLLGFAPWGMISFGALCVLFALLSKIFRRW